MFSIQSFHQQLKPPKNLLREATKKKSTFFSLQEWKMKNFADPPPPYPNFTTISAEFWPQKWTFLVNLKSCWMRGMVKLRFSSYSFSTKVYSDQSVFGAFFSLVAVFSAAEAAPEVQISINLLYEQTDRIFRLNFSIFWLSFS